MKTLFLMMLAVIWVMNLVFILSACTTAEKMPEPKVAPPPIYTVPMRGQYLRVFPANHKARK